MKHVYLNSPYGRVPTPDGTRAIMNGRKGYLLSEEPGGKSKVRFPNTGHNGTVTVTISSNWLSDQEPERSPEPCRPMIGRFR